MQGQRTVALPGVTAYILTTRKIELQQWELRRLNAPYWRLYWPMRVGGVIEIDRQQTQLKPTTVYLIPPHTTFSSTTSVPFSKWHAHFSLGPVADRAAPGIYSFSDTPHMCSLMQSLIQLGEQPGSVRFP